MKALLISLWNGSHSSILLTMIGLVFIALIIFLKWHFSRFRTGETSGNLIITIKRTSHNSKYKAIDVLHMYGLFWRLGLLISLAFVLVSFNWTTKRPRHLIDHSNEQEVDWVEIDIPVVHLPRETPPPPASNQAVMKEVVEIIETTDDVQYEKTEITAEDDENIVVEEAVIPKIMPIVEEDDLPPFRIVEQMPRFPGCEDKGSKADKDACAQKKLLEFIYANIKYPAIARENGVEGACVIQFVVEKSGKVTDARVVRDIGAGCGDEALRVVNLMNKENKVWTPGKQRGRAVRVQFTLPVKFKLQ